MTAKMVQAWIDKMPPADRETCEEITAHIRAVAKTAGRDVAINAVFLVAFELKESEPSNIKAEPSAPETDSK
jgi:hypothetical protein